MAVTQKIYDDFLSLSGDNYSGIIKFYENNIVSLDNLTLFQDREDFSAMMFGVVKELINKGLIVNL